MGARYARDSMRATARSRSKRDDDNSEVRESHGAGDERNGHEERNGAEVEGDDAEASGKPLGWLFRSS